MVLWFSRHPHVYELFLHFQNCSVKVVVAEQAGYGLTGSEKFKYMSSYDEANMTIRDMIRNTDL